MKSFEREKASMTEASVLGESEQDYYRLWCDANSPYSCKLRTYLNFKGIPYKRQRINLTSYMVEIPEKVGMTIMPLLIDSEDTVLQDTTPVMSLLEHRHPERACIPSEPDLKFLMWLLEDFGDEYLTRFSMHYRWGNDLNRRAISHRLARSMCYGMDGAHAKDFAGMLLERQSGFDEPLGLNGEGVRESLDQQIIELLVILDEHFLHYQFLLGNRPSLADFAVYGHLQAHLYQDPFSAEIIEVYGSRVCNWLDSITEFGDVRGEVAQTVFGDWIEVCDGLPETLMALLTFISKTYIPFASGTAKATAAGDKHFSANIAGIHTRFRTFQYRAWSFEGVQRHYQDIDLSAAFEAVLRETQIQPGLMENGILHCTLFDGFTPPVINNGIADARIKYLKEKQQKAQ